MCIRDSSISIHALLAESDPRIGLTCGDGQNISIHALLAESDFILTITICIAPRFLSTLSLRRATCMVSTQIGGNIYFYPRSPCGERRCLRCCAISCITISIHALLAESDAPQGCYTLWEVLFLSTLSLRLSLIHIYCRQRPRTGFRGYCAE